MRLSKALFVLPTLFTLTSVLLALVSVVSAAEGNFQLAALAILFAIGFDSIDGRVARLTRTQSKFGIQIDSLADVLSFGMAPAVLIYLALLKDHFVVGTVDFGLLVAFVYVGAGAVRLARYNVDADRKPGPVRMFTGLPIPAAAGCLAGMVLGLVKEGRSLTAVAALAFLLLLGLLMVSTVKYRKKVSLRRPDTMMLVGLLVGLLVVTAVARPAFVVFAFFAFYVGVGLVESTLKSVFHFGRRVRTSRRMRYHDSSQRKLP